MTGLSVKPRAKKKTVIANGYLAMAVSLFLHTGFQPVQHSVGGVMKAAPVHQEGRQAVAADGVVQQIEHAHPRQVQEHAVHRHEDNDPPDDIQKLGPVFPRGTRHSFTISRARTAATSA